MYDVLIVGAGPAGSTAAKILAESGYKVMLAEKFKMPRYKSCSGQLIKKSLDLIVKYFGESVPESVTCAPMENRGMIFTNDTGETFRFEQKGLNVWRSSFDMWLAKSAEKSGAVVCDSTDVVSLESRKNNITATLKGEKIYNETARYVVDCEGAVCSLKRKLLKRDEEYIYTYQTFNNGSIDLDPHYFYAYLQPELSEYDAWFNVKDGKIVLGVAVKDRSKVECYYTRFLSYMKEKHNLKISETLNGDRWIMPYIEPGFAIEHGFGNVLFAGEAAGFLNPMGEGISAGIESGALAAQAITNNFEYPEKVASEYRNSTKQLQEYMKRQWNFVAEISGTFKNMKV